MGRYLVVCMLQCFFFANVVLHDSQTWLFWVGFNDNVCHCCANGDNESALKNKKKKKKKKYLSIDYSEHVRAASNESGIGKNCYKFTFIRFGHCIVSMQFCGKWRWKSKITISKYCERHSYEYLLVHQSSNKQCGDVRKGVGALIEFLYCFLFLKCFNFL